MNATKTAEPGGARAASPPAPSKPSRGPVIAESALVSRLRRVLNLSDSVPIDRVLSDAVYVLERQDRD